MNRDRSAVICTGIAVAFSLFGDMALYTVLPVYYAELGLTAIQVGIILSANRWIRILTNQTAHRITRRGKGGAAFVAALTTGAVIAVLYGSCPVFIVILTGRLCWGLCWSLLRHFGIMIAVGNSDEAHRGEVTGLFNGITRAGSIVGTVLGGLLFDGIGYRLTFIALGLLSLCGLPFGIRSAVRNSADDGIALNACRPTDSGRRRGLLFSGFVTGCVGPGIIMSTLGYLLKSRLGDSFSIIGITLGVSTLNGILLSSRHIINTFGSPLLGGISDKIGHRRSLALFAAIAAIILITVSLTKNAAVIIPLLILLFVCGVSIQISLTSRAAHAGSRNYAAMATAMDIGSASGPLLGWMLVETLASPLSAFPAGAALYLTMTCIFLFHLKTPQSFQQGADKQQTGSLARRRRG